MLTITLNTVILLSVISKEDMNMKKQLENGTVVNIKGRTGEWGRVIDFDGEYYHVAFCDDKQNVLIFERSELRVSR